MLLNNQTAPQKRGKTAKPLFTIYYDRTYRMRLSYAAAGIITGGDSESKNLNLEFRISGAGFFVHVNNDNGLKFSKHKRGHFRLSCKAFSQAVIKHYGVNYTMTFMVEPGAGNWLTLKPLFDNGSD